MLSHRALVALLLTGCSTTATIHRQAGPAYEATIVDSDRDSLYVLGDDGREYVVPAEQVRDVDHPGNVLVVVGGITLGVAGLTAIAMSNNDRGSSSSTDWAVPALYGAIGLGLLVPGLTTWARSTGAATNVMPRRGMIPREAEPVPVRP